MSNREDDRVNRRHVDRDADSGGSREHESTPSWPGKRTQVQAARSRSPQQAPDWPGKYSPTQGLASGPARAIDPIAMFERAMAAASLKTKMLEQAIAAADVLAALDAAASLRRSLEAADKLVAQAPADHAGEMRASLEGVKQRAVPLLAKAPRSSREAIDEGVRGNWQRRDREIAEWRASVGGAAVKVEPTEAAEHGLANANAPLPHADLIQGAFGGHDISHVRARVGGPAGDAARALGAQAFASGDRIGFASNPDLHTAAHEAAHVVQQRSGVALAGGLDQPGDRYEHHADAVADAVVAGRSAEPLLEHVVGRGATPASSVVQRKTVGASATPMRKSDEDRAREQFNVHANSELTKAKYAGKNINAPAFLHLNDDEVRHGVRLFFADRPITTGNDQVSFVDGLGPFLDALFKPLEGDDTAGHVMLLRDWVAPTDLFALVDRNRAIFEHDTDKPKASLDYAVGLKGPSHWAPAVATAIGSALEPRLIDSLARMSARLVAATGKKRASGAAVTEHDLVPSHPLDWPVVMALLGRGTPTVKVVDGKLAVDPSKQVSYWKLNKIEWQGGLGGPWNAVRVEPADAGAESVATELMGAASQAYRIKRVGPYFIIPQDEALKHPEAVAHFTPDGRDPVDKLAFGKNAAVVGNAEAERTGAAEKNSAVPTAVALEQEWELIRKQIAGIQLVVRPYGLDVELAGAASHHVVTKLDLPTLSGHDAIVRGTMYTHQTNLLTKIAAEISTVVTGVESRSTPLRPGDPQLLSLQRLVRAANLSHLAETGDAALAEAHVVQRESITDGLEAMLGQVATQIEIAYQTVNTSAARMQGSASAFGTSITERANALRGRLAKLRSDILHNQVNPVELESLYREIDALRFETGVISEVGQLGQLFEILGKLEDSNWIVFSEAVTAKIGETDRLEALRRGAHELRGDLQTAHSKWLKTERAARAVAATFSSGGVKDADKQAATVVQPMLDSVRADLDRAGSNAAVQEFLRDAYSTVDSAQTRAMIVQIATMIGVALVSGGTATAVVGAAGLVAGSTAAIVTEIAVETVMFTTISQILSGDPSLAGFVENGIGNLATFGAMRVLGRALEGTFVGRTIAAGTKSGIKGIAYAAAKATEMTATTLVATGVQIAQAEYMSQLKEGRTMTMHEVAATGGQGIAMMIGMSIAHKVLPSHTPLGHEFQQRLTELNKHAEEVANSGDTTSAVELMRKTREYIESEGQRAHELEGKTDEELASLGIKRKDIAGLSKEVSKQAASLDKMDAGSLAAQLGLQTIVPGRVYAGEPQAVQAVIANYLSRGYEIKETDTGYEISKKGERSIEVFGGPGANQEVAKAKVRDDSATNHESETATPSDEHAVAAEQKSAAHEPRDIHKDHLALQQLAALPPEVMFGSHQHAQVEAVLQQMPANEYAEFGALVRATHDPVAQGFLYKALASNNSIADIKWFASAIAGKDHAWMIDNLTLGDPRGVGGGVKQQWSMSCNASMTITLRGNYDPVFALRLRERNMDVSGANDHDPHAMNMNQADLEKQMLESNYQGDHPGSPKPHQGVATPRSAQQGVGRFADDLLNAQSNATGMSFKSMPNPSGHQVVLILDQALSADMEVPLVIGDANAPQSHYVLAQRRRVNAGHVEYSIHDPANGQTSWVRADDIANESIPGAWHMVGTVEVPSAMPSTRGSTGQPGQPQIKTGGDVESGSGLEAPGGDHKRVTSQTPHLYQSVDPSDSPPNLTIVHQDRSQVEVDLRAGKKVRLRTTIDTVDANGVSVQGEMVRSYDPATHTLEFVSAFFPDALPNKVPHYVSLDPARPENGVPLSAYVQMQQLKIFGIAGGEVTHVKLKNVLNVVTVVQLEIAARSLGVSAERVPTEALGATHSMEYAETPLVQSGHRLVSAHIYGGSREAIGWWIDQMRQEGYGKAADSAEGLLKTYGIGRDEKLLIGFDIDAESVAVGHGK